MVLPRFVEAARRGAPLEVHGDGAQVRTFAHVEDIALDVARLALGAPRGAAGACPSGALNLGGAARASVLELAELVAARAPGHGLARPTIARVDPERSVGANFLDVRHRVPDLTRARSFGLARTARDLGAIVDDVFARHPGASVTRDHVHGAQGPAPRSAVKPCASPGS